MADVVKVKEEPFEECEDALSTLASAAFQHDSLPMSEQKPNLQAPQSLQPNLQLPRSFQPNLQLPQSLQPNLQLPQSLQPNLQLPQSLQPNLQLPEWSQPKPALPTSARTRLPLKPVPLSALLQSPQKPLTSGAPMQSPQTVSAEPKSKDRSAQPRTTILSVPSAQWFDVGIVRKPACAVTDYYFTESTIDHSADTSDDTADYTGLHKLALLPGVAYKFRAAALNSLGIGEWSEVSAFRTCLPGYPGAPGRINLSKSSDGVSLRWEPPLLRYGNIVEYSVCLAVKEVAAASASTVPLRELPFVRVYCGTENCAFVENSSLKAAYIERSVKPAIVFRIAARNEKGYGPATQVKWLQDSEEARSGCEAKKRSSS